MLEYNYKTTVDDFLDGKIKIEQPIESFRAGTDSVLLSAYNTVTKDDTVVELGSGVGTVSICLAYRTGAKITGIEKEKVFSDLAKTNITLNKIDKVNIIEDDILNTLKHIKPNSVDHVLTNPPYIEENNGLVSSNRLKDVANRESTAKLSDFIEISKKILKSNGNIWIIHQTSRLDELIMLLKQNKFGNIIITPIYGSYGTESTRILIGAKKDSKKPISLRTGIYLRDENNNYSKISEDITRYGNKIEI